jgi:hypothetical protein
MKLHATTDVDGVSFDRSAVCGQTDEQDAAKLWEMPATAHQDFSTIALQND